MEVVDTLEDSALSLRGVVEWTVMNPMTFHKDKFIFPLPQDGVGSDFLGDSSAGRDHHILITFTGVSTEGSTDSDKCQQHTRLGEQKHSHWIANTLCSLGHHCGVPHPVLVSPNILSKLNLIQRKARKMKGLEHIRRG